MEIPILSILETMHDMATVTMEDEFVNASFSKMQQLEQLPKGPIRPKYVSTIINFKAL